MARFRSLDPEFWQQQQLAPLPIFSRLLIIGLMSQADDHGRLPANAAWLQGILFPFNPRPAPDKINEALGKLQIAREIHLYEGTDKRDYLVLLGWKDATSWQYQVIQRPTAPKYPEPVSGFPPGLIIDNPRRPGVEKPLKIVGKGKKRGTG